MGVSRNDDIDPGCRGINVNLVEIVQHIERPAAQHDELGVRIVLCPGAHIYVPSYSRGRGNLSQSLDHFWSAESPAWMTWSEPASCSIISGRRSPCVSEMMPIRIMAAQT